MGQSPESDFYNQSENGTAFLQGIRTFGEKYPSYDTWTTKVTKLAKSGSVLLSVRAPVGEVNIATRDICIGRGLMAINGKSNEFLFQLFKAYKSYVVGKETGTVYGSVTKDDIAKIKFPFPLEQEQREIAEILSSLDDKIELNRKINVNLEKLASSLFKKKFVSIGNQLPEGWRVGTFGEAIINFDSKRIPLSSREREKKQGSYPYYGATSIMDYVDDFIFDGTYVLLGEDGSVAKEDGKPFVQYVNGKMWVNNHAHVLQGKNGFSTEYIKVFLDQVDIMPFVTGAVQPKLNQANMNSVPMIIPDQKTLIKFNEILSALFGMILENESQTKNLEQVRDSLLPRLMSGKIRVNI
ncbi:hypothetical protein A2886_01855 [candidate division WWE3 bacterium RIFCSPHIGHO2_01_FULL_42_13]|uniref:Type I restriction modification DNA specificity domain-containing protein n=1 Tax=candidate division WWE3 bacterium RIFCSPHIGHO2_01_FULL_42_13 TaxID=1802617 RepID=A0A1F4URR2_UNCKA|nr:MAG: hypothetical protein A2886_01855 [candidate division WWE3 bacterium RIFCSPHIGHO2_01_FULL_42_13]